VDFSEAALLRERRKIKIIYVNRKIRGNVIADHF